MIHLSLDIRLTLLGPLLTQATNAGAFGIDAAMARDRLGRPYLPYSLIRGKLRQALEELQNALPGTDAARFSEFIQLWFGPRNDGHEAANERGMLFFKDFTHPQTRAENQPLSRIEIKAATRAARERMIQVIDAPFQYGEPAEFDGEIRTVCQTLDQARETISVLSAGLRWMTQVGADRTVGFGRVSAADVQRVCMAELAPRDKTPLLRTSSSPENAATIGQLPIQVETRPYIQPALAAVDSHYAVRLKPRGLFCLAGAKRPNSFESEEIIPGNAILGALGTLYCMAAGLPANATVKPLPGKPWQSLARNFPTLRFTHAFPSSEDGVRPVVWPLSLVAAEPAMKDIPDSLFDVALCSEPQMISEKTEMRPPVFSSDWKSMW